MPLGIAVLLLFVSSCAVTKKFKENEFLLKRNDINIVGYKQLQNRQKVHDDLKQVAIQKPNIKAFGFMIRSIKTCLQLRTSNI